MYLKQEDLHGCRAPTASDSRSTMCSFGRLWDPIWAHNREECVGRVHSRALRTDHRLHTFEGKAEVESEGQAEVETLFGIGAEHRRILWVWRARRESNPRPTGSKPVALSS